MNKQEMIQILKAEGLDRKDCVVVMVEHYYYMD